MVEATKTPAPEVPKREIKNVATLDLTAMKAEDLAKVEAIINVATVIVPESLVGMLAGITLKNVACTLPVPDDKPINVRNMNGPVQMGGDSFVSDGGDRLQLLIINGPIIFTTPVTNTHDVQFVVNGPVFAPQGSENALGAAVRQLNGPLIYYRSEGEVKVHSGQAKLNSSVLANANGSPEDILLVGGQLLVTGKIESVGFKQIYVAGQALLPRAAEELLSPYLQVFGQAIWYTGTPRTFSGDDSFSAAFLEYLEEPVTLIINGRASFKPDVSPELLREKVTEIMLNGMIEGPEHLVPMLQVLTKEKNGSIEVAAPDEA